MCALMLSSVGYFGAQTLVETALRIARSVGGKAVVTAKSSTRLGKAVTVVVDVYAFAWRTYLEKPYDVVVAFADETTESARAFASRIWGLFTLKAILEVSRLAGSVYMLYALRHPAILPDQSAQFKSASKSVEVDQAAEARKKAETEAAAKKASAGGGFRGRRARRPEASKEKKKTRAEREAEAERERRRAARAAKKEARRKQKEKEEAEKRRKPPAPAPSIGGRLPPRTPSPAFPAGGTRFCDDENDTIREHTLQELISVVAASGASAAPVSQSSGASGEPSCPHAAISSSLCWQARMVAVALRPRVSA